MKESSLEDEVTRLEEVLGRWQSAKDGSRDWRTEARLCYDFVAGYQWDQTDLDALNEQERPAVTFNRLGVMVDAVCGLEINNRQQIQYFPRELGDVGLSELETNAVSWVRDTCHAEDEESEAFRDAVICGIGVTETRMDYEEDPDGKIIVERRDPLKAFYDPASYKKCHEDARWLFYADWMDNAEIENRWPDKFASVTPWDSAESGQRPQNADTQFLYKDDDGDFEKHKDQSLVLHYQVYEREEFYRALDPRTGKLIDFDKDKFSKVKKIYKDQTGKDLQFVKQTKKVYYRGFYQGQTELEYGKSPCQDGFTFRSITGKRDRNRRMWYGIVRTMIDPQKWANKWLSQILHIINTNAKGGAFVETNALANPKKAEEQWSASNPLIELNEGGISKIRERVPAQPPAGLDKLMTFAFESLPFVSGINLEALGLANREQAGVLESQRRKSAYGILAPLFDALRLYRKLQGSLLINYVRDYIADGRLVRILGSNGDVKNVQLFRDRMSDEYDILIGESPNSPDFREKVWEGLQTILPVMMKEGIPIPPSMFDYVPLPQKVSAELKQMMQRGPQIPPQVQQQIQQMQQGLQKLSKENQQLTSENMSMKADTSTEMAKLQVKHLDTQQRNILKAVEVQNQSTVDKLQLLIDAKDKEHKRAIEAQNTVLERLKLMVDARDKELKNTIDAHEKLVVKPQIDKLTQEVKDAKEEAKQAKKGRKKIGTVTKKNGKYILETTEVD